jgi:Histone chaperone Rttp106-like, middle domain
MPTADNIKSDSEVTVTSVQQQQQQQQQNDNKNSAATMSTTPTNSCSAVAPSIESTSATLVDRARVLLGRYSSPNCDWGSAVVDFANSLETFAPGSAYAGSGTASADIQSRYCALIKVIAGAFTLADHQTAIRDHDDEQRFTRIISSPLLSGFAKQASRTNGAAAAANLSRKRATASNNSSEATSPAARKRSKVHIDKQSSASSASDAQSDTNTLVSGADTKMSEPSSVEPDNMWTMDSKSRKVICTVSSISCLAPRGVHTFEICQGGNLFAYNSKQTSCFHIDGANVSDILYLTMPKAALGKSGGHTIVLVLKNKVAVGRSNLAYIVMSVKPQQTLNVLPDLELCSEEQKTGLSPTMQGPTHRIFVDILRAILDVPVHSTSESQFRSTITGSTACKCVVKAHEGHLFMLRDGVFFMKKPMLYMPHDFIGSMQLGRGGMASTRTVDLLVELESGEQHSFDMIEREESEALASYVQDLQKRRRAAAKKKAEDEAKNGNAIQRSSAAAGDDCSEDSDSDEVSGAEEEEDDDEEEELEVNSSDDEDFMGDESDCSEAEAEAEAENSRAQDGNESGGEDSEESDSDDDESLAGDGSEVAELVPLDMSFVRELRGSVELDNKRRLRSRVVATTDDDGADDDDDDEKKNGAATNDAESSNTSQNGAQSSGDISTKPVKKIASSSVSRRKPAAARKGAMSAMKKRPNAQSERKAVPSSTMQSSTMQSSSSSAAAAVAAASSTTTTASSPHRTSTPKPLPAAVTVNAAATNASAAAPSGNWKQQLKEDAHATPPKLKPTKSATPGTKQRSIAAFFRKAS